MRAFSSGDTVDSCVHVVVFQPCLGVPNVEDLVGYFSAIDPIAIALIVAISLVVVLVVSDPSFIVIAILAVPIIDNTLQYVDKSFGLDAFRRRTFPRLN